MSLFGHSNIRVQVLADSVNPQGVRLFTVLVAYPRFFHADVMTHRGLSRNASSSRAIPTARQLKQIINDPAMPEFWGRNQSGMQANGQLTGVKRWLARRLWRAARWPAVAAAWAMNKLGLHKQLANRVIEPWQRISVLMTATDQTWNHLFSLRAHPDAQPEFQVLAFRVLEQYLQSEPTRLRHGEWHIPFRDGLDGATSSEAMRLKVATGRSARLSYLTHDGEHSPMKDVALHNRLAESDPIHASPFEHCAKSVDWIERDQRSNFDMGYAKNGSGWLQYRKTMPNEFRGEIHPLAIMDRKPEWVTV